MSNDKIFCGWDFEVHTIYDDGGESVGKFYEKRGAKKEDYPDEIEINGIIYKKQ